MSRLYCKVPYCGDELVEFVGVHSQEWGKVTEPTESFWPSRYTEKEIQSLIAVCKLALDWHRDFSLGIDEMDFILETSEALYEQLRDAIEEVEKIDD